MRPRLLVCVPPPASRAPDNPVRRAVETRQIRRAFKKASLRVFATDSFKEKVQAIFNSGTTFFNEETDEMYGLGYKAPMFEATTGRLLTHNDKSWGSDYTNNPLDDRLTSAMKPLPLYSMQLTAGDGCYTAGGGNTADGCDPTKSRLAMVVETRSSAAPWSKTWQIEHVQATTDKEAGSPPGSSGVSDWYADPPADQLVCPADDNVFKVGRASGAFTYKTETLSEACTSVVGMQP